MRYKKLTEIEELKDFFVEIDKDENKKLIIMPLSRILVEEICDFRDFYLIPPNYVDFSELNIRESRNINDLDLERNTNYCVSGQPLREICSNLTGFNENVLFESPVIVFVNTLNWSEFRDFNHQQDIDFLKTCSSNAERVMDLLRLFHCRLDLPDTLPGQVGSWENSYDYLGALVYSAQDKESCLIAGQAVECSKVVRGIGLDIGVNNAFFFLPTPDVGEMAKILIHGLSLYSEALMASNETVKFIRVMTLLEFLADPYQYKQWKKLKGDIICHCVKTKTKYLQLSERFKDLSSHKDDHNNECGIRTLIIHQGKLLPDIIVSVDKRRALFKELQGYCYQVLYDMLRNSYLSWDEYSQRRIQIKEKLGVLR